SPEFATSSLPMLAHAAGYPRRAMRVRDPSPPTSRRLVPQIAGSKACSMGSSMRRACALSERRSGSPRFLGAYREEVHGRGKSLEDVGSAIGELEPGAGDQ